MWLSYTSSMFKFAVKRGWLEQNPAAGVALKTKRHEKREEREPWTDEDLAAVFNTEYTSATLGKQFPGKFWGLDGLVVTLAHVFPDLDKTTKNGYGDRVSKWFGRWRRRHGVTSKRKVLHSLRNTVATRLKYAGVEEFAIAEVVGHENPNITTGRYGARLDVGRLAEVVAKLNYGDALQALRCGRP